MVLDLLWDGSDLGDISKYYINIIKPIIGTVGAKLTLRIRKSNITCYAWKYKDDIPLIIDELKPIFGLIKIGRHKCIIEGVKLLIARIVDIEENITCGELKDCDVIRQHLAFRYLLGVITRGEFLWYRPTHGLTSYKDCGITFVKESSSISISNINKWFDGERNNIISTIKILLKSTQSNEVSFIRIVQAIRIKIDAIIRKINQEYIYICSGFMSRVQIYLSHIQCDD